MFWKFLNFVPASKYTDIHFQVHYQMGLVKMSVIHCTTSKKIAAAAET